MGLIRHFIDQANKHAQHLPTVIAVDTLRFIILAGIYCLATHFSDPFAIPHGVTSFLWPPAAIGLYATLRWGWSMAPAIALGALFGALGKGLPFLGAILISIGCALEACIGAALVGRVYMSRTNFIYEGVFRFMAIAVSIGVISASFGVAGMRLATLPISSEPLNIWLTWWLSDAISIIVGVPLLLEWRFWRGIRWTASKLTEAFAFWTLFPVVTQVVFGAVLGPLPASYIPLPFLLWAALRFNMSSVCWAIGITCMIVVWNTAQDNGPFATDEINRSLTLLIIYVSVVSTAGLALASAIYQRSEAENRLRAERDTLEQRVRERTERLEADLAERKRIEARLAIRERQLAEAQRLAQLGSWNWDLNTKLITWSDELYRIYGVNKDSFEVTPANFHLLVHPDDQTLLDNIFRETRQTGKPFFIEHRVILSNGSIRIVATRGQGAVDSSARVTRLFGTVQDVTEARLAEASLREAEERYRMVVELSPDAVLVQQDDVFVFANPGAVKLLHAQTVDQVIGRPLFDYLHPDFHADERERIATLRKGEPPPSLEQQYLCLDGTVVDVEVSSSAFVHKGAFATLYIMRDISERKKTLEQMAYMAHYDSLTGLPNRSLFRQRLEHALDIAERPGRSLEILFLDLDRFKVINDTLGHDIGDIVLRETATRLQTSLRESDTVARLGGDEFVVLVENVDEPHRGGIIAEKILTAITPPFIRDKSPLAMSTSICISSYPGDGTDAETLLKKADLAMYRAKKKGRNNYCYFSQEMNLQAAERTLLEHALSHAIEQNQLSLHYQPRIDVTTNRITGMEALLRWQHPTLGMLVPQRFIPVAEETGMIKPIGYWTIRTACVQNKHWQEASPARLKVAVNLSRRQLSDENLVDNIAAILNDTALESCYLEFEITESTAMADMEKTISILAALRSLGVSIVIDHFGVGSVSLAYLHRLPICALKIDRSLVQGVPSNHADAAMAKAIIGLAHNLEYSVIAEGTETQQQYDFLCEQHCDSVQGFYFSEPMPAARFNDLIHGQSKLHLH